MDHFKKWHAADAKYYAKRAGRTQEVISSNPNLN